MARDTLTAQAPKPAGRLFLYGGLVFGVVAAILVAMALSNATKDDNATSSAPTTRAAVVAAKDIPANTRITADMLKVGFFKVDEVDTEAFGSTGVVVNRVTAREIKSGEAVTPTLVSATKGESLTFEVSPGMRGVSIEVEEVVTAGGNVIPGDRVDLIGVFKTKDLTQPEVEQIANGLLGQNASQPPLFAGGRNTLTLTLLQNVKVLAVDQSLPADTSKTAPSDSNANPRASTVTLEVTPEKAQILALAGEYATLRLSLRPFGEDASVPLSPFATGID